MGANAQTTVPTFTAGQVLTAAQMNDSARTGVPVFATTGTRDAGFGGSGEKTLAEGQMCYVEGTGFQTYNGTSWITWGTAPDVAGLTLISSTTIGTTVSSVTVSNAFSATYDNYLITVDGGVASTSNNINLTLGATVTGYYYNSQYQQYSGAGITGENAQNAASWLRVVRGSTNSLNGIITLLDPFASKNTHGFWQVAESTTAGLNGMGRGYLADTTSYTAFTLTCESGTFTGGTVRVYGFKN